MRGRPRQSTPFLRQQVIALHEAGLSYAQIAAQLHITRSKVQRVVERHRLHPSITSLVSPNEAIQ